MSNRDTILEHFYAGATKNIKFTFTEQDITDWKLILVVKDGVEDSDPRLLSITHTVGDSAADDALNGILNFTIDSTSSDIPIGRYHYQFIREIGNSTPRNLTVIASGRVKVMNRFEEV